MLRDLNLHFKSRRQGSKTRTKLTNNCSGTECYAEGALVSRTSATGLQGANLKKLLRTVEALADLGPELTADRDFRQTAGAMVAAVMESSSVKT